VFCSPRILTMHHALHVLDAPARGRAAAGPVWYENLSGVVIRPD